MNTTRLSTKKRSLFTIGLLVAAWLWAGNRLALADHIWLEAEAPQDPFFPGSITSPMNITDTSTGSGGGYIEAETGSNSTGSMPTTGQACYDFNVSNGGNHRIWGRVYAPNTGADSFWVRMDNGSTINWNQIPLTNQWIWDDVHANANPSQAIQFNLSSGSHRLCVGYREDGTLLDGLLITSNSSFDPRLPAPNSPPMPAGTNIFGGGGRIVFNWGVSPGASTYTVQRRIGFGGTVTTLPSVNAAFHRRTESNLSQSQTYCYRVRANAGSLSSSYTPWECGQPRFDGFVTEAEFFHLTFPLRIDPVSGQRIEVAPPRNSTGSPPSTGWARHDFRLADSAQVKIWGAVVAPNTAGDSFWVRMDNGPWVNWNNWQPIGFCGWEDVHNSSTGGNPVVYNLESGYHKLEFAYREDHAQIDKVFVTTDLNGNAPGGCFD